MSDLVLIAIIAATPPTVVAIGGLVVSLVNRKKIADTSAQVAQVSISIDGRMEQLLEVTKGLAKSQGHAEGKEQERGERRGRDELQHVAERSDLILETAVDTRERVMNIESEVVGEAKGDDAQQTAKEIREGEK